MTHESAEGREPVLRVVFYRTEIGNEPVREWLKGLEREDRKAVGQGLKPARQRLANLREE